MTAITFAFSKILIEHTGWVLLHSVWQFAAIALLSIEEFRTVATPSTLVLSAKGGSLLNRVHRLVNTSGANNSTNSAGAAAFAVLTLGLAIAAIWFTSTSHAADDKPVEKSGLDAVITDEVPARECINLRGICRNEKGDVVEGVWIRVYGGRAGAGRMDKTAKVAEVATDREGKFHVTAQMPPFLRDLPEDSVGFVAVFSLNRGSSVVMKSWSGAAIDDDLDVTISRSPFTLRGTVLDQKGKPIQGASLFVRNGLNVDIPASHNGLTNVEGQFEIPGLQREEAKRFLCVYHRDYGQKQVLHQYNGENSPVAMEPNIILEAPGVLSGAVIDSVTQRPQANCIVTAQTKLNGGFGQGVTDSFGHYLLPAPAGDYMVAVGGRPHPESPTKADVQFSVRSGQTTEVTPLLFKGVGLRRISDGNSAQSQQVMSAGQPTESSLATVKPQQFRNQPSGIAVSEMQDQVKSLLAKLKDQQEQNLTGKDEWALTMKSLIELGPDSVPALSEALDQTAQDDRLMLRSIPFVLRGIGDKRAVPALIRAIPKCFGADGSDMGYLCEDADLLKFMQQHDSYDNHDASRGAERDYNYSRPVNEVFPTLEKWTGHKDKLRQLHFVRASRDTSSRTSVLGQRLYNQAALEWQSFWEANWAKFITDEAFAKVSAQLVHEHDADPPISRDVVLGSNSGSSNNSLESVYSVSWQRWDRCFSDLDTGLDGCLSERFLRLSRGERLARMDEIVAEAEEVGFDLMGSEMIQDGKSVFVLQPIGLEVWEISKEVYDGSFSITSMIEQGRRVNNVIAHYDEDSGGYDLPAAAYFFVLTPEGTPVKMLLGVPITSTNYIGGPSDHTRSEFQHTHMQLGRRYALQFLKPKE